MKRFLLLAFTFLFSISFSFAQECEAYFPMQQGTKFELTNYDAKGKKESRVAHEVLENTGSGDNIVFKASNTTFDKKDKEVARSEYTVRCDNGKFSIDLSAFFQSEQMAAYEGSDITVDGDFLEFPSNPQPGQTLPDATMTVNIGGGASTPVAMKMTIYITNRKVEAIEDITTPAGTFNCVKMSQDVSTKMVVNVKSSSVDWYAKDVGMVRQESYRKNGKMIGYSELTSFTQ